MSVTSAPVLTPEQLATGVTYAAYRQQITDLLASEPDPRLAKMLPYYRENEDRMDSLEPTILPELQAAAQQIEKRYIWVVITEGWCGDAAQLVPIIEAVAQASNGHLETRYFLRDANTELIDRYLTNGGRAIPMTVLLHADSLTEAAVWGPRPNPIPRPENPRSALYRAGRPAPRLVRAGCHPHHAARVAGAGGEAGVTLCQA